MTKSTKTAMAVASIKHVGNSNKSVIMFRQVNAFAVYKSKIVGIDRHKRTITYLFVLDKHNHVLYLKVIHLFVFRIFGKRIVL